MGSRNMISAAKPGHGRHQPTKDKESVAGKRHLHERSTASVCHNNNLKAGAIPRCPCHVVR